MRILFVADGRSPTALNWIGHFLEQGHEVHLVSTFGCAGDERLASLQVIPVAFSSLKSEHPSVARLKPAARLWGAPALRLRTSLRHWLGPLTLPAAARRLADIIEKLQPELVHAMRIPYEGMLAALAAAPVPLLVSVWGNDFTLHAPSTPLMRHYTRRTLLAASGLHADCRRDVRLARQWGFPGDRPATVLPGAGGVQPEIFFPPPSGQVRGPLIINPRGIRAYVRNDTFFRAIPLVLEGYPQARFLCTNMAGEAQAERWVAELGLSGKVELLPLQTRAQMAELFRQARLAVSPSVHDGTPNTLLEAMACGCLPVAGDLESLREWITPGVNGLLVDAGDPQALAVAIRTGLELEDLQQRAQQINARLIAERATHPQVMAAAERYYQSLL